MISSECNFERFIDAIKALDAYEIIYLADKEATAAWRISYKRKKLSTEEIVKYKIYQNKLIGLIDYSRQNIGSFRYGGNNCSLYRSIQRICK